MNWHSTWAPVCRGRTSDINPHIEIVPFRVSLGQEILVSFPNRIQATMQWYSSQSIRKDTGLTFFNSSWELLRRGLFLLKKPLSVATHGNEDSRRTSRNWPDGPKALCECMYAASHEQQRDAKVISAPESHAIPESNQTMKGARYPNPV